LRAFLRTHDQDWIEDPSNQAERFDRVRWRKWMAGADLSPSRLADTAARMGRAREALHRDCAALAAESATLHPAGFARIAPAAWRGAAPEISLRLLANLVRTIAGADYVPRHDGLERLHADLLQGLDSKRTLGGCVFAPGLIYRETRAIAGSLAVTGPGRVRWDNRFTFWLRAEGEWRIEALGTRCAQEGKALGLPRGVLAGLPAIVDKRGNLQVPPLGYDDMETGGPVADWGFAPTFPLTGFDFRLAGGPDDTI
jgi:tRNA(Ile)-lysidine synthase